MNYHLPVLPEEAVNGLAIVPGGTYADATFGGGGHARRIMEQLVSTGGKLIAFDQDPDAAVNKLDEPGFELIKDNFRNMKQHLERRGMIPVNGIIADLGVSSHQFDVAGRGFTFRMPAQLDMRMDQVSELTAAGILNTWKEPELVNLFSAYGEIRNARTLAATLVKKRLLQPFTDTQSLLQAINHLVPPQDANGYLARLFQSLRIAVNDELGALEQFLADCPAMIRKGGRLVVIAYHSLEDRLVKNFIAKGNTAGIEHKDFYGNRIGREFMPVNRKPIVPAAAELAANPRSRSAKLRIAERV